MFRSLLASVRPVRDDRRDSTEGHGMDALAARVDHLARQYGHRATFHEGRVVVVPLDVRGRPVEVGLCGCPPHRIEITSGRDDHGGDLLSVWTSVHESTGAACVMQAGREQRSRPADSKRRLGTVLRYVESELRRRA